MLLNQFASGAELPAVETAGTLDFKPRQSRLLARFLIGIHVLALITVLAGVPNRLAMVALLMVITLSFFRNYRRHVLHRGARAARRVVCQEDGRWRLQDHLGVMHDARLLPSSYLHPQLVILNFALDARPRRRNLVLCPDSLDMQTLRQLRVRLRVVAAITPAGVR